MKRMGWLILAAAHLGCNTTETAATIAPAPAPAASIAAKPGSKTPTNEISSRPKPSTAKIGCNYNPSCKLNCEWCGINTCTCRLKGID